MIDNDLSEELKEIRSELREVRAMLKLICGTLGINKPPEQGSEEKGTKFRTKKNIDMFAVKTAARLKARREKKKNGCEKNRTGVVAA
jgi:tRNA nucleotidyltransferase (CCA-adding enzyme)